MSKLVLVKDNQLYQAETNEVIKFFEVKFLEIIRKNYPKVEKQDSDFIKPVAVCNMLEITKPTLDAWVKKGIITKYTIETRVYFRRSEIIQLLEESAK